MNRMDSYIDMSIRNCESIIKFGKKTVRGQILMVSFNVALLLFNWQTFRFSPSSLTAWGFGAMAVTVLWSLIFLFESWREHRLDKQKLCFLNELHDTQMASKERETYMNAKNYYEHLIEQLKEKQNGRACEVSTEFNS